jgi:hypothetical protein
MNDTPVSNGKDLCVPSSHSSSFWYGLGLGVVMPPLAASILWLLSKRSVATPQLPRPLPPPDTLAAARRATTTAGFCAGQGLMGEQSVDGPMTPQEQVGLHAPCPHSGGSSTASPEETPERETRIRGARGCSSYRGIGIASSGTSTRSTPVSTCTTATAFGGHAVGMRGSLTEGRE